VYGSDPGIVLKLNISIDVSLSVFDIKASGTLQINTTGTTRLNVPGHSFLLSLSGDVSVLKVLKFNASFTVRVQNGGWRFDFSAALDFFGLVTLQASGWLDSGGNFDILLNGHFQIGSSSFGLSGGASFHVWAIVTQDNTGNP
jgi:hypothetical protein